MQRSSYKYFLPIQTRWMDNDQYGHVNNVAYYSLFDTVYSHFQANKCVQFSTFNKPQALDYVVESGCNYKKPLNFPDVILAGLGIVKIGKSSFQYAVGLFAETENIGECVQDGDVFTKKTKFSGEASAVGYVSSVFVDSVTQKPVDIPVSYRTQLEDILIELDGSKL